MKDRGIELLPKNLTYELMDVPERMFASDKVPPGKDSYGL
jgi:hypothetical protein